MWGLGDGAASRVSAFRWGLCGSGNCEHGEGFTDAADDVAGGHGAGATAAHLCEQGSLPAGPGAHDGGAPGAEALSREGGDVF